MRLEALWAALTVVLATTGIVAGNRAKLKENGYEGIVIAISQEVDETQGPAIVAALMDMVSETSRRLFRATMGRAYFRTVHILIPKSWEAEYVNDTALNENFLESEIRVDLPSSIYRNQPYTSQPGGCGEPGQYIHLTPEYLTDPVQSSWWGPKGKVLLMEWAKLRWGVFDELGYPGDESFPLFYILDDRQRGGPFGGGTVLPTYCADKPVEGRQINKGGRGACPLTTGGIPDENCRFLPYKEQLASSSLMSYPFIFSDTIVEFCNDSSSKHPHNSVAPTKQNLFCGGRSVWEVMMEHEDFANDANPPTDRYVDPVVRVVQHTDANYALVLDYSGSMNDHYRIHKLRKTARRWLLHEVADGSHVAIVKFSKRASLVHSLTKISGGDSRKSLANSIETSADGGTSIGAGLYVAIRKILIGVQNPVILLITDGEENENPRIKDILQNVIDSGVRIVTVAFGSEADKQLEEVAQLTGGKTFTVNDIDEGRMLEDAFVGALTYQPPPPLINSTVTIHEMTHKGSEKNVKAEFDVDFTVGRNLILRLDTNDRAHVTQPPHLIRPDGGVVGGAVFDPNAFMWTVTVPMAEQGRWQWHAGVSGSPDNFIRVKVTAQTRDPAVHPITTRAWISSGAQNVNATTDRVVIYAEVKQGNNPVINAHVRALVTPPNEHEPDVVYILLDNGQGADTLARDGVYSRYMTHYSGVGRYSVKAQVTDGGVAMINSGFLTASSSSVRKRRSPLLEVDIEERPEYCCGSVVPFNPEYAQNTGGFNRLAVGGSVKIVDVPETDVDTMPPDRVRDLRVLLHNSSEEITSHNLTLSWTAPGDDFDTGTVSAYDVRVSANISEVMLEEFNPETGDIVLDIKDFVTEEEILVEAGSKISFNVTMELNLNMGTFYYFTVQALDEVGQRSTISNVAVVGRPLPPGQSFHPGTMIYPGTVTYSEHTSDPRITGYSETTVLAPESKSPLLLPIWAIVSVIIILILIAIVIAVGLSKRRYGKYDCVETGLPQV